MRADTGFVFIDAIEKHPLFEQSQLIPLWGHLYTMDEFAANVPFTYPGEDVSPELAENLGAPDESEAVRLLSTYYWGSS